MIKLNIYLALVVFFFTFSGESLAMRAGTVATVKSGDIVSIKNNVGLIRKVRLYGIDAPDSTQPYSERSRQMLKAMIGGKVVTYEVMEENSDGLTVALVYLNNISINGAMVKAGYAWVHPSCSEKLSSSWKGYQRIAQGKKSGLWQQANPIAPWQSRVLRKEAYAYTDKWQSGGAVSYERSPNIRDSMKKVVNKRRITRSSSRKQGST